MTVFADFIECDGIPFTQRSETRIEVAIRFGFRKIFVVGLSEQILDGHVKIIGDSDQDPRRRDDPVIQGIGHGSVIYADLRRQGRFLDILFTDQFVDSFLKII